MAGRIWPLSAYGGRSVEKAEPHQYARLPNPIALRRPHPSMRRNDDLDVVLLVVDQFLEAAADDVFQADAAGDQRFDVQAAVGDEGDHVGEFAVVGEGADDLFFGGDQLEEVERTGFLEDADQHALAGVADDVDGQLGGVLVADALETDVGAEAVGAGADFRQRVAFLGIEHQARAHFQRLGLARRGHFQGDHLGRTGRLGAHDGAQADGAGADHHHVLAEQAAGLLHRVHAHRQRFDQRAGFGGEIGRQLVEQFGRYVHQLGEGAVVHQPGEGQLFAEVVQAAAAVVAGAAVLAGVGGDPLAGDEAAHAGAELDDLAAEFVAEDALALDAGERVGLLDRDEHRAGDVFVQVRAADAAPVDADLHPAGRRVGGQRYVFDADVLTAVPDGGAHGGAKGGCHCSFLLQGLR